MFEHKSLLVPRFGNDLEISDNLYVMDSGASNSKDMKLLRSHLQELRTSIISVSITELVLCLSYFLMFSKPLTL